MKVLILFATYISWFSISFSQNTTSSMDILDTVLFEGVILVDQTKGIYLINQEQLKKYDLFDISRNRLKKIEDKNIFLPYLEIIDFIRLSKKSGQSDINQTIVMPVDMANGLISLYNDDLPDISIGIVRLNLLKISCDSTFILENLRKKDFEVDTTGRIILYTLAR